MKPGRKWIVELPGETPIGDAGGAVLKERRAGLCDLMKEADRAGGVDAKMVHAIRVSARRMEAALEVLGGIGADDSGSLRKLKRRMKRLRRTAGVVRDVDVHIRVFQEVAGRSGGAQLSAIEYLVGRLRAERERAEERLLREVDPEACARLRRRVRSVARSIRKGGEAAVSIAEVGRRALAEGIAGVRQAAAVDLNRLDHLHNLRLAIKALRYRLELSAPAIPAPAFSAVYTSISDVQERLGEVNDSETVLAWLDEELEAAGKNDGAGDSSRAFVAGLGLLRERFTALRDRRLERLIGAWGELGLESTLGILEAAASGGAWALPPSVPAEAESETWHGRATPSAFTGRDPAGVVARLAAIDVGSNSVRLVIAEAYPDGTYRIVDDEKEQCRLARGLAQTGRLDRAVMDQASMVIARLCAIADGYGCSHIRAVATAAVREAANGREFIAQVRARARVDLRVISAEEEGRLAFQSVAHAFADIRTLQAGMLDIGGGSTEVVLSSAGVIDDIASMGMGAVSLTERFGGPEKSARGRYKKMRAWIRKEIRRKMPQPRLTPAILVGAGGTITALASMAVKRDRSARGGTVGAAPATVQGYQVSFSTARDLLREIRGLNVPERARVPGMGPDRADIIVAGLCVAVEVMRHLGVRRLRVHTFGVREGLLQTMMREVFPPGDDAAASERVSGRLRAARRFAQSCRYEERHSEHVARLSLQLFDALAPLLPGPESLWEQPVARDLLEAAAVLHDIGYIVNYAQHHKHAYHLIMHADLLGDAAGGFSRREVEVLANVVRYHRRAEPKSKHPGFAALSEEDQHLVRCLASILRIADGLDRTHTQNVGGVRVAFDAQAVVVGLDAAMDPATDVWGATRKSGLFGEVFGRDVRFEWRHPASRGGRAPQLAPARPR